MNGKSETISSLVLDGGAVTQTGTETLTVSGNVDARSGTISGGTGKLDATTLTKSTSGLVTLACRGSSAASGGITTTIVNQGTLTLDYSQNNSKLKDSGSLTINSGTLVLAFGSHTETVASVSLVSGIISNSFGTASLSLPSPGNYDMQTGAVYTVLGGTGGLIKSTPGDVSLNAANTFSGDSRIGAGSLTLGDPAALSKSTLDMNTSDSGSLSFGTLSSATLGGLKGSRNLSLQNGSSAAVSANVGNNNQSTTYTGTIGGSGTFNKVGTGTFFLDGTISAAALTVSAGKLGGNGTITAPVTLLSGGTVSPGDPVGRLNINNTLTLSAGGNVIVEIDKAGGTNDLISGLTGVTYGGTLSISNLNTPFAAGDSFKIFNSASYTASSFDAIIPATPDANLVWDTSRLTIDGTIKVANAGQSGGIHIDQIAVAGTNVIIGGSGGSAGVSYALLNSADVTTAVTNWTVLSSNVFDGAGNFSETNGVAGQPKLFFIIRSP
jgi:autotransporter-associated beta strand protein